MSEMTEMPTKRDEILGTAERMIRTAGYNGFSTRDVANAVGIKAASVHSYFPTKSDIGVAVTERYTERFLDQLGDPEAFEGRQKKTIEHYVDAFRQALVRDGNVCLCAVLGAEIGGLPMEVGEHARIFFERNLAWLKKALTASSRVSAAEAQALAIHILATLEGSMILSKSLGDDTAFESVAESLAQIADD